MMSTLTQREGAEAPATFAGAPDDARVRQVSITPTGARRMRFLGREVASASSRAAGRAVWHEAVIYLRQKGGAVLTIRAASDPSGGDRGRVAAWRIAGVAEALDHLAEYDAGADVTAPPEPEDGAASAAELAAAALDLRAQVALARRDFGALRSEICERLAAASLV